MDEDQAGVPPALEGEVGLERAKDAIEAELEGRTAAAEARAAGRPAGDRPPPEVVQTVSAEFCGEVLGALFAIPAKFAQQAVPVEVLAELDAGEVWPLSPEERSLYGKCLYLVWLEGGQKWAGAMPLAVLAAGLGMGLLARVVLTARIARAKKARKGGQHGQADGTAAGRGAGDAAGSAGNAAA